MGDAATVVVQLREAVEAMMNPTTPQQLRLQAYQACEEFKETSALCAECGVLLAAKTENHIVRHFGLQLLEHCVKYRWNKISPEEKIYIKDYTMKLLSKGTLSLLHEEAHIKDGLSRVVVEMIKREWPQQWPTLLDELNSLCSEGPTQTELVMLIFLRLAEDVLLFQNVPHQRKREILQALTVNMPSLFTYFVETLKTNFDAMKGEQSPEEAVVSARLVQATLNMLAALLDWINMTFIIDQEGMLLQLLCLMLQDTRLQLSAAECLLVIASRKNKIEDRKPILMLFNSGPMNIILQAVITASEADLEECHYIFLKKTCQVLTALGTQLSALWGVLEGVSQPPHFLEYLTAILAFTSHPSQMLGSFTQTLWAAFMRHEHISADPVFLSILPDLIETTHDSMLKVGFPSQTNSSSCACSRLDFDSDEDFNTFYSKYRAEIAETIRLGTKIDPVVTFQFSSRWLQMQLGKTLDIGDAQDHCNLSSPAFLEWDALTVCLESVMSRLMHTNKPKPPVQHGIVLLKAVLAYETQDPLIRSSLLSCISALFIFLSDAPNVLPTVLDKIFSTAVFNLDGQTKATRSKGVKNVRRHACSVLVKICKQYPNLLLPGFDQLYTHIKQLSSDPDELSQMEKCTLMEALMLISNQNKNFERQCCFLGEILTPVKDMWMSAEMKEAVTSTDKFLSYVGLNQPPVEPSSEDTCGINRSRITYCINTILAVLKRSTWPEDIEDGHKGGFVTGQSQSGTLVLRNPATPHIIVMLDNVLALTRTLNALWQLEFLNKRHTEFSKAYDMPEYEKEMILGIQPPVIDNTDASSCKRPWERMQLFIATTHNNCYHILGNVGQSLGHELYQAPQLAASLVRSVLCHLDDIPDFRLKPLIRVLMKPYMQSCPKEHQQVALLPVLAELCPYMLQRLSAKWADINQRCKTQVEEEDNPESQEILEEQLARQLTRDYMDFLACAFRERKGVDVAEVSEEMAVDEGESGQQGAAPGGEREFTLSDLGQLVLATETVYPSVVLTLYNGLTWKDTMTCNKCLVFCWPILKYCVSIGKMGSDDVCHLFMLVLQALQQHGQHEGIQATVIATALSIYENLKPTFPALAAVLLQVQSCTEANLLAFEEKLQSTTPQKQLPEKRKKESFRKLVQDIIGQNVGQQFKKDVLIKNLPPLCRASKPRKMPLEDDGTDVGLCALFNNAS